VDYGAKAGAYVDAFMANLSWTAAEQTFLGLST
jgi:superoxide dismutase